MNRMPYCLIALLLVLSTLFNSMVSAQETTRELNGGEISYHYSSGRAYNVKFEEQGLSYRYLTGSKPNAWWGPFPYQAIKLNNDEFFLSWFEKQYGDYVTLLVNYKDSTVHGSAILRGEEVHFHAAKLVSFNKP